jgi:hypothetical protein
MESNASPAYKRVTIAVILCGLVLQIGLALRSWIGGDQVHMLALGWQFATTGHLEPFSKMMSGAGANPGVLLQLLVGAPLAIHPHFRSPLALIILFDLLAVLLLWRLTRETFSERMAMIYIGLYSISPWRLYHSSFLWEPQYLFLPAAVHLWACWKLRREPTLLASALLAASIVLALQLHNSFAILLFSTIALVLTRRIRLHFGGVIIGLLFGSLTLLPTIVAVVSGTLPAARESQGYLGWGLLHLYPVLKGLLYWARLGSLDVGIPLAQTLYLESAGEYPVMSIVTRALQVAAVATIIPSVLASWWYFRPLFRRGAISLRRLPEDRGSFEWFRDYALATLAALLVASALSPIVLQGWQVIIALHAALLPVALWLDRRIAPEDGRLVRIGAAVIAIAVGMMLVIGTGNRIFRPGELPEEVEKSHPELLEIIP